MQFEDEVLDVAIIGAGIGGIACLAYAKRAGLKARAFDKQDGVGGLWRQLPAWQDIQIGRLDWELRGLPLADTFQPAIEANLRAWVDHFGLAGDIELSSPVHRAAHADGMWMLDTPRGTVRARHLIAASGAHNDPLIPPVRREQSLVTEIHSSALRDGAQLAGRSVLVVGGGASAFDLLDLCFEHGAGRVHWVHRGVKWFTPTRKGKEVAGSVRGFARLQESGMSTAQQNAAINEDLRGRYEKLGLKSIMPAQAFDVVRDQLIPGRHRMIGNFAAIERRRGTVASITGRTVTLDDGSAFDADVLLWGTGYAVDLSYFALPEIASIRTLEALRKRCGGLLRSIDAPNLYFPGVCLDGIGSATFAYALIARSIASHIRGGARFDMVPVEGNVNHFDLVRYLAERDPANFPAGWRDAYRALALQTPDEDPYPLP
jgi:cation diffusion facilitator CzcD-associated flavoprotein CzcO